MSETSRSTPESGTTSDLTWADEALRVLARAGRVLGASLDYEATLKGLARLLVPSIADCCVIHLREPEGRISEVEIAHHIPEMETLVREALRRYASDIAHPKAPIARIFQTGEATLIPEVSAPHREIFVQDAEHARVRRLTVRSYLAVPMIARGEVLGVISLAVTDSARLFDAADLALAGEIASRAAVAVDHARLYLTERDARQAAERAERERAETETARRQAEEQLRQRQKMEAVGRLAGGVAHEVNNMMTAVLGYADLVYQGLGASHPYAADVLEIHRAAERAAAVTRQLLAFSQRQVLRPAVLDVNATVEGLAPMLERLLGADRRLVRQLSPAAAPVLADQGQLEHVLVNLVLNARDATPSGGQVSISTDTVLLDEAGVGARTDFQVRPGRYTLLAVSDTGTGMAPEVRARAFEPFFTTKPPGAGTGLGLSSVYGIVKQSGGYVWVYSEPGFGTTVKVYLPESAPPRAPAS